MAPLESYPGSDEGRSKVLGEIAEEDYFKRVRAQSFNFLREGGLEARAVPAEFGVWRYATTRPVLIIREFSAQARRQKRVVDDLGTVSPRSEDSAGLLVEKGLPLFFRLRNGDYSLIIPTGTLKEAMERGLIPGVKPEEAADLSQDEVWEKMLQRKTARFFGLSKETKKEIRWWLGEDERRKKEIEERREMEKAARKIHEERERPATAEERGRPFGPC